MSRSPKTKLRGQFLAAMSRAIGHRSKMNEVASIFKLSAANVKGAVADDSSMMTKSDLITESGMVLSSSDFETRITGCVQGGV